MNTYQIYTKDGKIIAVVKGEQMIRGQDCIIIKGKDAIVAVVPDTANLMVVQNT